MNNNINSKTTPNQMREFIKRMRNGYVSETKEIENPKKDLSMRDMLKITRQINENIDDKKDSVGENRKIPTDQSDEETKFTEIFNNMPDNDTVSIVFFELYVFDNLVYWGGIVDGTIEFTYQVTPNESKSGVIFDYHNDYSPDNPKNDEITKRIEAYYNKFSEYWRNEVLNGNRRV
jgi:hypothetical protein